MVKISEIIGKFAGNEDCIHFQYDAIEETSLRWVDKKKTKYKPARAKILLPEMLCPDENLMNLKKYEIMLIAIPKDKLYESFPDLCPSGDLIADKQNPQDIDNKKIVAD